jgi:guanylate kinase
MEGFKNVVKRWLKIERSKSKAKFMARKKDCLVYIEPPHWEKLKAYWSKPKTERKAEQMSNARRKMTNMANAGQ